MSGLRRNMMAASRGAGVDWESIARGMIDNTTEFVVPSSISVNVSNYLFLGRTGLLGFTIPSGVTTIPMSLCEGCSKLQSIEIPSTVTKINQTAFQRCGLTTITIPSNVTSFGAQCFTSCRQLTKVIMQPTTPPTFGVNMFLNCTALTGIFVPDASVDAYKAASGWSAYADRIMPLSELGGGKRVVINWLGGIAEERSAA